MRVFILFFLFLAACDSNFSPGDIEPEATRGIPAWVAPNFYIPANSARRPLFTRKSKEVIFRVQQGDCSTAIKEGASRSDCTTKTTRSVIKTGESWTTPQRYILSFEFWVDPTLAYRGYANPRASKTDGYSSQLAIARWQGEDQPNNQLFDLKLDAKRGVTFMGKTCVPPSGFGSWHRFYMRIRWADDDTGFIEVRCDQSLYSGVPVFAKSNFPTTQALDCFRENNCDPKRRINPKNFSMQLGILFDGSAGRMPRIGAQGLTVKMRRIVERRLAVIFGRVEDI